MSLPVSRSTACVVGVPNEIKAHESRVAMTPVGVEELTRAGHKVLIQAGAGQGSGISDDQYRQCGAEIVPDPEAVWRGADLIVKVKEPLPVEWPLMRAGQVVLTYCSKPMDKRAMKRYPVSCPSQPQEPTMPPVAHSYVRFSDKKQKKGHSVARQTQRAESWCQKHGVPMDTSRTWHDLGKSAYLGEHRKNPDRHALAAFLKLVEDGKIPRGSFLIIESLDRLTREHVRAGLMLCLALIEAGIRIVQLSPAEIIYDEKSDEMALMLMIVELSRGHGESKRKSELIGPTWQKKRELAREGVTLTRRLPAWVTLHGAKRVLIPHAADTVRLVFHLAAGGYGVPAIMNKFQADGVRPLGRAKRWTRAYIRLILRDRRALGELQLNRGDQPDGEPIADYYPAVVGEVEYLAARAGAAQRSSHRGRTSEKQVNIFAGLLKHARDGDSYQMTQRENKGKGRKAKHHAILVNYAGMDNTAKSYSLQYHLFESAVLKLFREIKPAEVLGGAEAPDLAQLLGGEIAGVDGELALASEHMETAGFSPTIGRHISALEAKRRDLVERLSEAQQKAASPLSASWGEAQSLAEALAAAADPRDARLRLRSALRRVAESMWVLVVPRGALRLAVVQVHFAGGKKRDYLIRLWPASRALHGRGEARWLANSLTDVLQPGDLDLREPDDAAALERLLQALDLSTLTG